MNNGESPKRFLKCKAVQISQIIAVLFLAIALCFSAFQAFAGGTRTSKPEDFTGIFVSRTSQGSIFILYLKSDGKKVNGKLQSKNPIFNGTIQGDLQTRSDGTLVLVYTTYQSGLREKDRQGSGVMDMYTNRNFSADHVFLNAGVAGRIQWVGQFRRDLINLPNF
jgi:hypothetical protein